MKFDMGDDDTMNEKHSKKLSFEIHRGNCPKDPQTKGFGHPT
jgi:hypothetical protein